MTDDIKILLTGLVSSGLTLLLSKFLDFLQSERAHKIELKKQYFAKRLDYAEKTIAYLNEKAQLFENVGIALKQIDLISQDKDKNISGLNLDALEILDDSLIKGVSDEDVFILNIPPAMFLYFKIDPIDIPNQSFTVINHLINKRFHEIKANFSTFKVPDEAEKERVSKLSAEERGKWILELFKPFIELQANFQLWSKTLFDTRDKLQILSMKIEKEFHAYM